MHGSPVGGEPAAGQVPIRRIEELESGLFHEGPQYLHLKLEHLFLPEAIRYDTAYQAVIERAIRIGDKGSLNENERPTILGNG
jgi:hypothetical protein